MKFFSRVTRFFVNAGGLVNAIIGAAIVIIVGSIMSITVLPLLINGSDGGIGEQTLPILQTGILVACIFAAIGLIVYAAKSMGGGR